MSRKKMLNLIWKIGLILLLSSVFSQAQESAKKKIPFGNDEQLVIVWTSGDKEVAMNMVYMYAFNAKKYGWWKDITMIVWGPSSKLLSADKELQDYVKKMKDLGIVIKACKACADAYNVSESLTQIGVEVKYMGVGLTDFIKNKTHIITF